MAQEQKLEQNQQEQPMSFWAKAAVIGFFGGLLWSLIGYIAYILNFSKVGPALVLSPWALGEWKTKTLGQLIGIVVIAFLSVIAALLYKAVLAKLKGIWAPIIFGVLLWFLVFYVLRPIFPNLEPIKEMGWNTITTTLCIYILYGLFVGYSISFDYHENQNQNQDQQGDQPDNSKGANYSNN
ncbi:YqhR family membrane protein [Bacillus taeanensis]|uniref:Uncharacterized protein n=1 Tax=Bacillus taeanensis TaxID=273032 RepID=A0A366XXH3_9BACI|nr:YqhR family membrane protein [Bacillus taeanensis]RBW70597.1 hypothetical protein DS031_06170 [Bacillus taeanensis]